jgi:hypothetical protein
MGTILQFIGALLVSIFFIQIVVFLALATGLVSEYIDKKKGKK